LDAGLLSVLAPDARVPPSAATISVMREAPSAPLQISHQRLLDALEHNDFQPARAARELGIARSTIYELIRRDRVVCKVADFSNQELRRLLDECQGDVAKLGARLRVSVRALHMRLSKL
jgi:DNA-binding NtrC family response regulator